MTWRNILSRCFLGLLVLSLVGYIVVFSAMFLQWWAAAVVLGTLLFIYVLFWSLDNL